MKNYKISLERRNCEYYCADLVVSVPDDIDSYGLLHADDLRCRLSDLLDKWDEWRDDGDLYEDEIVDVEEIDAPADIVVTCKDGQLEIGGVVEEVN